MFKLSWFTGVLVFPVAASVYAASNNPAVRVPVLLELFTSEGCSSCPPADRLLEVFDRKQPEPGADLIVLSEHVDYWNQLGWKDPFSAAQFSARQQDYADRLKGDGVYTPELVVDGRFGFVGSDERAASSAIQKAVHERKIPVAISNVSRQGNQVTARIDLAADEDFKGVAGILYVVVADNRQQSHVARGENAGHSLAHVSVARSVQHVAATDLDRASTKEVTLQLEPGSEASGSRIVAFVQDQKSGHIIGVAGLKL